MKTATLPIATSSLTERFLISIRMVEQYGLSLIAKNAYEDLCCSPELTQITMTEFQDILIGVAADKPDIIAVEGYDMAAKLLLAVSRFAEANEVEIHTSFSKTA